MLQKAASLFIEQITPIPLVSVPRQPDSNGRTSLSATSRSLTKLAFEPSETGVARLKGCVTMAERAAAWAAHVKIELHRAASSCTSASRFLSRWLKSGCFASYRHVEFTTKRSQALTHRWPYQPALQFFSRSL